MSALPTLLVSVLTLTLAAAADGQISIQPPQTFAVSGKVYDSGGNPLDAAEVTLVRNKVISQPILTGTDGRFNLGQLARGGATIRVRRLGYEQLEKKISIGAGDTPAFLDLLLQELPQKLEEVLVKADEEGRLREFYEHKKQRSNFGKFFDRVDIRTRNPSFASELLRSVPGMHVQSSGFGGNSVSVRGCKPLVWMDGQRIPGAELDDVTRPADIAGLEVYPSNAGIPAEFMDRNNGVCGIIVVWTKSQ